MMKRKVCTLLLAISMLLNIAQPWTKAGASGDNLDKGSSTYEKTLKNSLADPLGGMTGVTSVTYDGASYEGGEAQKEEYKWREGMVTGNGEIALIESCNPTDDTLIFQNTKFNMPNNDIMDTPNLTPVLDQMRQAMVKDPAAAETEGKVWELAEKQGKEDWGLDKWLFGYDYSFHPGQQLRLKTETRGEVENYKRWTNYETAEIGVGFTDDSGTWIRRTFASRADNVIITCITKPSDNQKIDMTLSLDNISEIKLESGTTPDVRYKVIVPGDASYISQVVHYPEFERSTLNKSGYATVTKVITDGIKEKVSLENSDEKNVGENAAIHIQNADRIVLVTKLDRGIGSMGAMEEFQKKASYPLLNSLISDIDKVEKKYQTGHGFDYQRALENHMKLHQTMFNSVKLDLKADPKQRALPNEELLKQQSANKNTLYKAMIERAYNAGRYAAICSTGYSTSRLGGIWTGVFNPNWQGDFTTDANVNLQVSGANTGDLKEFGRGYINFLLRIADDFQYNAEQIYGMTDAIMASARTDGENGFIYHINAGNPFFCWNAGTDWQLLPIYEYWQCYGNETIPVGKDVDVKSLKKVLDLSEIDIRRIEKKGFDLQNDILWPLLKKHAHFWEQYVDPNYYMDKAGNIQYDVNHKQLADGETYLFLPTYSPENHPDKPNEDVVQINATMDIAAARDGLDMAISMANAVGEKSEIEKWAMLKSQLPNYKYQPDNALMEWSINECENRENYGHRHFGQMYPIWPGYEAEDNSGLRAGALVTMDNKMRDGQNSQQSHGWMHKGLAEARLKNGEGVIESLKPGMTGKVYYTSMMTAHNVNGGSAYCTDTEIATPGIINEALLFSRTGSTVNGQEVQNDGNLNGEIELLPALPKDWDQGSVSGLRARTQAQVKELSWNIQDGYAEADIISLANQTITVNCGVTWSSVAINGKKVEIDNNGKVRMNIEKGETKTIRFELSQSATESTPTDYIAGFRP